MGPASSLFRISDKPGVITFIRGHLDRETVPSYNLIIQAVDDGNLTTTANLTINLEDVNDNYPLFKNYDSLLPTTRELDGDGSKMLVKMSTHDLLRDTSAVVRIPETMPSGSRVTQVVAHDQDAGLYSDIRYIIESQTSYDFADNTSSVPLIKPVNSFSVDPRTGVILVNGELLSDHFYLMNVSAIDGGGLSTTTMVSVAVYDVNNNAPKFHLPIYNFNILEGSYLVGEVGLVTAVDSDSGQNAEISYQIVLNDTVSSEHFPFRIGETSGMLLATGQVDREQQSRYQFYVYATDHGDPPQSTSVTVHISVSDSNDHDPKFYGYQTILVPSQSFTNRSLPVYQQSLPENVPTGTLIVNIFANDSDSVNSGNGIVLYKILEPGLPLNIDSKNGSVFILDKLDHETSPTIRATIIASDVGTPTRSATAMMEITVTDVREDLTDRLFDQEQYVVSHSSQ